LWFLSGFGVLGFHRFYLGKPLTGVLWAFTGGFFVLGAIYDFFTLPQQVKEANIRDRYRESLYHERKTIYDPSPDAPRRKSRETLEQVILRTAKKNNGKTTPSEVALEGNISLEEAKQNLEKLAQAGYADMKVTKTGVIVYVFPDFASSLVKDEFEDI
jgi:hypothetical protein